MANDYEKGSPKFIGKLFFSSPNSIAWDALNSDTDPCDLIRDANLWIDSYDELGVMILPFKDHQDSLIAYAFAENGNKSKFLLAELEAFLGRSWTNVSNLHEGANLNNSFEISLINEFKGTIVKIGPIISSHELINPPNDNISVNKNKTWDILTLYRDLLLKKPSKAETSILSFGNLRRDFDKAIFVGNIDEAEKKYQQLIAHGRLSFENKIFLEIRKLSGFGMWNQILAQKQLMEDASKLKLPQKVRSDLIEAFYNASQQTNLSTTTIDAEVAFSSFQSAKPDRFPRLFSTRQGIIKPKVLISFIFWELLSQNPDRVQISDCLKIMKKEDVESQSFIAHVELLVSKTLSVPESKTNTSDISLADEAYAQFEHEKAFRLYQAQPTTIKIIGNMITCAKFIKTPDVLNTLIETVQLLETSEFKLPDVLKNSLAVLKSEIENLHTDNLKIQSGLGNNANEGNARNVESWLEWSRLLHSENHYSENQLCIYVEKSLEKWSLSSLKTNKMEIDEFANNLFSAEGVSKQAIDRVWVNIVDTFLPENLVPTKEWKPIYNALFSIKITQPFLDENDLESIRILLTTFISSGLNSHEYENLIQDLKELIEKELAFKTFEWAMDICEVISVNRASNEDIKNSFINYFLSIGYLKVPPHRLNTAQIDLVEQLSLDIGQETLVANYKAKGTAVAGSQISQTNVDLNGKQICIYTLTESAGKRSKETLERLFPGVTVELNNDHAGTDRLKSLAKNSDIFVFAAKSSTHAAYYFVKNNRDTPMLHPTGKGSASIISAIMSL